MAFYTLVDSLILDFEDFSLDSTRNKVQIRKITQ